jgi:hypothetical protein
MAELVSAVGASPERKKSKTKQEELEVVEGMPPWAVVMQRALASHVTNEVAGLRREVGEAKAMAMEAQEGVRELQRELRELKGAKNENPTCMKSIRDLEAEFRTLKASTGNSFSSGAAKSEEKIEKAGRTVTFGQFPKDTKSADVVGFIQTVMKPVEDDIEEVFAFGRSRAERGAARFKTKESMWNYMSHNRGEHQHKYQDDTIFCNVDSQAGGDTEKAAMEKAVRKVVRTIIEKSGGDGPAIKKLIETDYRRGIVWYREVHVAEWHDGSMGLLGEMQQFADHFTALLAKQ